MVKPFEIKVNGDWSFKMDSDSLKTHDQARLSPIKFHVIHNSNSFEVEILETNFDAKTYHVSVNGKPFAVEISNPLDQLISEMGFELGASKDVSHIEAPMPGLILDVQVSLGDQVKEGEPLLILEAMKMENVILSPRDGTIARIAIAKGEAVDKKSLLLEFE